MKLHFQQMEEDNNQAKINQYTGSFQMGIITLKKVKQESEAEASLNWVVRGGLSLRRRAA